MQKFLDRFAIGVSGLCAIHCLLTPVALTLLPLLGVYMTSSWVHFVLYLVVMPSSMIALYIGCKKHKDMSVIVIGAVGLFFLSLAASTATEQYSLVTIKKFLSESLMLWLALHEHLLTILGGLFLITAHARNFYLCRHDHCEH